MAAVTVVVLLLLDVHVEVGRTPASADGRSTLSAPASTPNPRPRTRGTSTRPSKERTRSHAEARRFAWAPTKEASAYQVELFLGDTRVFAAATRDPQITVPARWTYRGKRHSLAPGEYRWLVWPVVSGRRTGRATVQSSLTISAG